MRARARARARVCVCVCVCIRHATRFLSCALLLPFFLSLYVHVCVHIEREKRSRRRKNVTCHVGATRKKLSSFLPVSLVLRRQQTAPQLQKKPSENSNHGTVYPHVITRVVGTHHRHSRVCTFIDTREKKDFASIFSRFARRKEEREIERMRG